MQAGKRLRRDVGYIFSAFTPHARNPSGEAMFTDLAKIQTKIVRGAPPPIVGGLWALIKHKRGRPKPAETDLS